MTNIEVKYLLELLAPHNLYEICSRIDKDKEDPFLPYFKSLCNFFEIDSKDNKSFLIILEYLYYDSLIVRENSIYIKSELALKVTSDLTINSYLYNRIGIVEDIKNKCKELCI